MYRMITRDSKGRIIDIQEGKKAYFWNKDGRMTKNISRWVFNQLMQGDSVSFKIC
jgi:hypothetical protein